ncbi:MAG: endopeptidase La, partial [Victivallales bacterium]|nr:endopeptidase La [Victivallales bacterium]
MTNDRLDVKIARRILDRDHYGLEDVKKRILEFIGVSKLKGEIDGSIICLIGPPGVGKTSLGHSIAEAVGRKFFRFSLGGMRDEAEIKGHRRTYIGALPGKVIEAVKICGSRNPVIMLDEIDKLGQSYQGDPASALLEVLDPEQNVNFRDHYLDIPFDLSKVMFIATANTADSIPTPLLDRMEQITLSGYITEEKLEIAKRHLIPKLLPKHGLKKRNISFTMPAISEIANSYAREAGVRALEKSIKAIMRKAATDIAEEVQPENLETYLGKPRFTDDELMKQPEVGVAMGLAWTALGGATLYIEAVSVPGKGELQLTGQLGDVMKESIHIARTVLEANSVKFGIPDKYFKEKDIHVHVPAGATPKDGPSAGITMAVAMLSLATNRTLPRNWAMTGELTLKGRVLPVGGIKEKTIAAKRAGVLDIIMPKSKEKDFTEIPERVRKDLTVHYVEQIEEVFNLLVGDSLSAKN